MATASRDLMIRRAVNREWDQAATAGTDPRRGINAAMVPRLQGEGAVPEVRQAGQVIAGPEVVHRATLLSAETAEACVSSAPGRGPLSVVPAQAARALDDVNDAAP